MPRLGPDMDEGVLIEWRVDLGQTVEEGAVLALIETDKTEIELPARWGGVVRELRVSAGETVEVGTVIAVVGDDEPSAASPAPTGSAVSSESAPVPAETEASPPAAESSVQSERPNRAKSGSARAMSPVVRRLLDEHGLSADDIVGTGPNGRISRKDVEMVIESRRDGTASSTESGRLDGGRVRLTKPQLAAARRLSESKSTIPEFAVSRVIDVEPALAFRDQHVGTGARVSVNDLIVFAVAKACLEHPRMVAALDGDELVVPANVDVALAVATDGGLMTPVIASAETMTVDQLGDSVRAMVERTRAGRLQPDDLAIGSITVSNLGMFGVSHFTPIINPPHCAIVGVGAVEHKVLPTSDAGFRVGRTIELTVVADHRIVDGVQVAQFLASIEQQLTSLAA